ncbi:MAG: hypothetical protein NPIRA01_22830 [Nitrospirales bacterium]|nr:MAG: hypothetical protein NPIRA01_22830 [Nitrospirales bacterium]
MKLLLDTCISRGVCEALRAAGHDVIWTGEWLQDPGDSEILDKAFEESRILITLDKDFGELAIVLERPHAGIVRLVSMSLQQHIDMCHLVLNQYANFLRKGAIVTAESGRIRVRPPVPKPGSS